MTTAQWAGTFWLAFCVIVVAGSSFISDGVRPAMRWVLRALEQIRQCTWRERS